MSGLMPPGPLSYEGQVTVPYINRTFPPTTAFNQFNVPTVWTDTLNENVYMLVSKPQGVANWVVMGSMPGEIVTLTGNTGGAIPPMAGNINISGDHTTGLDVSGNSGTATLTISGLASSVTQVGTTRYSTNPEAAAQTLTTVALTPSNITSLFSTHPLTVAQGGTGDSSFTAYALIAAGTTSTGAFQNVSGVGTAGQILVSSGAAALPSWQSMSVVTQVFTGTGTYTPTSGMKYCIAEVVGGGAGGAGVPLTGAGQVAVGGGGSGAGYARKTFSAADIGVSKSVTIGAGGAGGVGNSSGAIGGTTSLGAILSATGGTGGANAAAGALVAVNGTDGGDGGSGDLNVGGGSGFPALAIFSTTAAAFSGTGGSSIYGAGGEAIGGTSASSNGTAGEGYGAGGSGACNTESQAAKNGGAGSAGIVIITEFVW